MILIYIDESKDFYKNEDYPGMRRMIEIIFLGTSGMAPTKERNVSSIYLEYKGEGILVDCGEAAQRQLLLAGKNRLKIRKILITHWHGDHVSGLIGLLQTISNSEKEVEITIIGPRGTKERMECLQKSVVFDNKPKLIIKEVDTKEKEVVINNENYYVEAINLHHSVPVVGYSFVEKDRLRVNMNKLRKLGVEEGPLVGRIKNGETIIINGKKIRPEEVTYTVKGKKVTFILDTLRCEEAIRLAENSDLLITEATFASDLEEKALETKHLTTKDAAQIAIESHSKKLIITHFSQRYKTVEKLEEEIKTFFPNSECAYDLLRVKP